MQWLFDVPDGWSSTFPYPHHRRVRHMAANSTILLRYRRLLQAESKNVQKNIGAQEEASAEFSPKANQIELTTTLALEKDDWSQGLVLTNSRSVITLPLSDYGRAARHSTRIRLVELLSHLPRISVAD
jgi:hypothetical protein